MTDTIKKFNISNIVLNVVEKASLVGIIYLAGYCQWSLAWFVAPVALLVARDRITESNRKRRDTSKIIALTDEKDVITGNLKDLPAWVFFPDIERAEWINRMIKQLWPNLNQFVRELVRDKIQPIIHDKLKKKNLTGFRFETIRLGSVPVRVGGVKVYDKNIDRNEIVMDLDIWYSGDCNLSFQLSGFKGGIKDFQLHGLVRIIMKPLITSVPLIGGVQIFFLDQPKIDFELTGVADLLEMPGISGILKRIIYDTVASMMVLPNKLAVKLSEEVDTMELKTPEPEGVLRVHVFEARNLMRKDVSFLKKGKSDPYAVVSVGVQEYSTKVIDSTVDPKWDYWCEFEVMESDGQQLHVQLWDKDDTGDNEKLGSATIDISNITKEGKVDKWYNLDNAKHGMVHLRLTWLSLSSNYADLETSLIETQQLRSSNLNTALLILFIDSARNLPRRKISSDPDPYAVIDVGNKIHQTNALNKTKDPVWEEGFTFLLPNPENDSLTLRIIDKKTESELGELHLKIKSLCDKNCFEISKEPFSLVRSGPESKIVLSLKLKILKVPDGSDSRKSSLSDEPMMADSASDGSRPSLRSDSVPSTPQLLEIEKNQVDVGVTSDAPSRPVEEFIQEAINSTPSYAAPPMKIGDTDSRKSLSTDKSGLGRIQLTFRYSLQRQHLIVVVHKIMNLPLKDPSNIPDPYVKLYLLPERHKDSKRRTQVVKDNCNPVFDETFEYAISQEEVEHKEMEVTVCTQKQLFKSSSNVMGKVVIDLSKMNLLQPQSAWFDLQPDYD